MWIHPRPQYAISPLWTVITENRYFAILKSKSTSGGLLGKLAGLAVQASDANPLTFRIVYLTKSIQVIAVSESLDLIKEHWVTLERDIVPRLDEHDWDVRDQYVISKIIGMAQTSDEHEADQNDEKSLIEFKQQFVHLEEKLLTYFTCSLWWEGYTSGKLFITQQSVCYYSSNPVQHIILPFNKITAISKESTLGLFPSTIIVKACIGPDERTEKKFLFYVLLRDHAYDTLEQLWKLCIDELYQKQQDQYHSNFDSNNNNNINNSNSEETSPTLRATKQRLDIEKNNKIYQRYFKLPETEELLRVHVCWIVRKKNSLLGDLYLSANFFCVRYKESFSSKRYTTVLPISKIASIEKTKPFLGFSVFTDTLEITTTTGRVISVRLMHCDEALQTMLKYWQHQTINHNNNNNNITGSPTHQKPTLQIESIAVGWFGQEPGLKQEDPEILKDKLYAWEKYFNKNGSDSTMSITNTLAKLIRRGVPDPYRGHIWAFCSGACFMWEKERGYYDQLLNENRDNTSTATEEIEKDVRRTFSYHPYFRSEEGVASLRRVLTAYSWRNPSIGYCQSMNIVAGIMLMYMQEEAAFWVLCRVCEFFLKDYYAHAMIGSVIDLKIFEELVAQHLPDVYAHLTKIGLPMNIVSTPWFMCMFVSYIPFPVATRVVDCVLLEGTTVLFQTGLAILKINKKKILGEKDSELVVDLLRKNEYDIDELVKVTFEDFNILEYEINELRNAHKFKEIKRK